MAAVWISGWALLVAWFDLRDRRVPNALSLGGLAAAIVWLVLTGATLTGDTPKAAFLAFGLALLLTGPGYALKMLGAGDVKLLAAFAVMSGLSHLLVTVAVAGLTAGMFAFAYQFLTRFGFIAGDSKKRHIPMGAFFALGILVAMMRP